MAPFIPILIGLSAIGAIYYGLKRKASAGAMPTTKPNIPGSGATKLGIVENAKTASMAQPGNMVAVQLGKDTYLVSSDYIGPVGIGEAADIAKSLGMELPTPALVDAIWRQADLKLVPMNEIPVPLTDAVRKKRQAKITAAVAGRPFVLLGGAYKDIVVGADGFPQLYGWHVDVENGATVPGVKLLAPFTPGTGKVVQPLSGRAHALFYGDYSQGLRLVKKVTGNV